MKQYDDFFSSIFQMHFSVDQLSIYLLHIHLKYYTPVCAMFEVLFCIRIAFASSDGVFQPVFEISVKKGPGFREMSPDLNLSKRQ